MCGIGIMVYVWDLLQKNPRWRDVGGNLDEVRLPSVDSYWSCVMEFITISLYLHMLEIFHCLN